jgi:hypothetical protein
MRKKIVLLLFITLSVVLTSSDKKPSENRIVKSESDETTESVDVQTYDDPGRTLTFSAGGISTDTLYEYDGRLAILGKELVAFRALYGRDPISIEEFLNSPGTIFWPVNPFTNEPFEYTDQVLEAISMFGKLSLVEYEGKKWIVSVIPQDRSYVFYGYPLPSDNAHDSSRHYLASNPYPLTYYSSWIWDQFCGTYAIVNERLPRSVEELISGFLIIKENWPEMSELNDLNDEGYFEIGTCAVINEDEDEGLCKMLRNPTQPSNQSGLHNYYYQLVNIPGVDFLKRGKYLEYGLPGYECQFTYVVTCTWDIQLDKVNLRNLIGRTPLVSSVLYPNASSLPADICILKSDILN